MTEKEKNERINKLMEEWKKGIDKIPDENYGKYLNKLDNGNSGEYGKITEKYRKLINEIKNR